MLAALFKKQFLELNTFYFRDRRTGKHRSPAGVVGFVVLFLLVFLGVAAAFFGMADMLSDALIPLGMDWLYFALLGLMSLALGVFGSVFTTYAGLYQAKDNELLLAMPIPPSYILLVRTVGVYAMGLLYSALVWLPAVVQYALKAPSVSAVVAGLLLTPIIAALVAVLTCALGWVVALIAGRLKNRSFITVILSFAFIGAYYFFYSKLSTLLTAMVAHSAAIGTAIRTWVYPIYQLGRAATGKWIGLLIFTAVTAALCALCWWLLSRSFFRMVTTSRGGSGAVYREKAARVSDVGSALLRRELHRLASSPTYMLNCGLGLVVLPVASVAALIGMARVRGVLAIMAEEMPPLAAAVPVLVSAAICMALSMGDFSAPSVSLEGKTLWIVQSLPVDPWRVLGAKLRMHILLNAVPAVVCTVLLGIVVGTDAGTIACMTLTALAFVCLSAAAGLVLNLKHPNLNWTNETVPIKQSMSVFLALFGGWILALLLAGGWFAVRMLPPWAYLLAVALLFGAVTALLMRWLKRRGTAIFSGL